MQNFNIFERLSPRTLILAILTLFLQKISFVCNIARSRWQQKDKFKYTELKNTTERVRLSIPKTAAAAAGNDAAAINIHNYRLHIYQSAIRIQNKCTRPAELGPS
jgi:hypothetical protein